MYALHTNIYVTKKCDRHCSGCYYPKSMEEMSRLTAYNIATWITKVCKDKNVEQYRAHFLGGEPFKNYEVMLHLIEHLEDKLPSNTKGAKEGKYVIFTNGDSMAPSRLRRLKHWHTRLMLNPTYDKIYTIEEKIKHIKSHMGGSSLAVVADTINLPRLSELTNLMVRYNGHIRINRLYNGAAIPGYIEEFGKQMHKVFDILLAVKKAMWPDFIFESLYITWPGPKNPNFCGKYFLAFDPDGSIRSCNADMDTKMGHINTHSMKDLIFPHRWSAKNLPECQGCEWITWCQGGCPYTRKLTYGTYGKKTPFCEVYKTLFPRLMELKDKWIQQTKQTKQE